MIEHPPQDVVAIADVEDELDVPVRARERAHQRGHERLSSGRDRGDPKSTSGGCDRLARGSTALLEQADDVGRVRRESGAGLGRLYATTGALEEVALKLAAQRGDGGHTEGCVTTSSSAAAVTEPPRMTARNAVS